METTRQQYSRPVRRGFGMLVHAGLRRHMEALIAEQARHPKRSERFNGREKSDILAMVEYIEQEAETFYQDDIDAEKAAAAPAAPTTCDGCGADLNPDSSCPACTGQVVHGALAGSAVQA